MCMNLTDPGEQIRTFKTLHFFCNKCVFSTLNWLYDYYYSFSVKPPSITAYVPD